MYNNSIPAVDVASVPALRARFNCAGVDKSKLGELRLLWMSIHDSIIMKSTWKVHNPRVIILLMCI